MQRIPTTNLPEQKEVVALIDEKNCIGCTLCLPPCPVDAIVGSKNHVHTVLKSECTGCELCVEACPVDCIKRGNGKNVKGTDYYFIDFSKCIDCGVCLAVCPVTDAVIPEERSELQLTKM